MSNLEILWKLRSKCRMQIHFPQYFKTSIWKWYLDGCLCDTIQTKIRMFLLCVSCPSANEFSAILFLLFALSSSNSPQSFQRFRPTLRRNFNWIRQQMKNFPIEPHCKNCPLFYNGGLWGNSLPVVGFERISHQSSPKTFQWSRWVWAWSGKK